MIYNFQCAGLWLLWLRIFLIILLFFVAIVNKIEEKNLLDIGFGKEFLNMTPNSLAIKAKIDKQDELKLKLFYTAKKTTNKVKLKSTEWGRIFQALSKELISKMHMEFQQFNSKNKSSNLIKNGLSAQIDISWRKTYKNKYIHEKMFNITDHRGNATQNQDEMSYHNC